MKIDFLVAHRKGDNGEVGKTFEKLLEIHHIPSNTDL